MSTSEQLDRHVAAAQRHLELHLTMQRNAVRMVWLVLVVAGLALMSSALTVFDIWLRYHS